MFVFRKIWRALFSCNTRFEIHSFALLPTICCEDLIVFSLKLYLKTRGFRCKDYLQLSLRGGGGN